MHSMRVLEFLMCYAEYILPEEAMIYLDTILKNMDLVNCRSVLPFLASLISDVNKKNYFEQLKDFSIKFQLNKQINYETVLLNNHNLIFFLTEMMKHALGVLQEVWEADNENSFALIIKTNFTNKKLLRAGMGFRNLKQGVPTFIFRKFKLIYRNKGLAAGFNRLSFIIENSVLNEILFIFYNLIYGKRRNYIKKILNQERFITEFLAPIFDLIFSEEIDEHLKNYVSFFL